MGADFLTVSLMRDEATTLNWDILPEIVASMTNEKLDFGMNQLSSEAGLGRDDMVEAVVDVFTELRELLEGDTRDLSILDVRGAIVYLAGGMSWGDSPSDAFQTIVDAWCFPYVLNRLGFEVADPA